MVTVLAWRVKFFYISLSADTISSCLLSWVNLFYLCCTYRYCNSSYTIFRVFTGVSTLKYIIKVSGYLRLNCVFVSHHIYFLSALNNILSLSISWNTFLAILGLCREAPQNPPHYGSVWILILTKASINWICLFKEINGRFRNWSSPIMIFYKMFDSEISFSQGIYP